jgi:hypothetical protein
MINRGGGQTHPEAKLGGSTTPKTFGDDFDRSHFTLWGETWRV